MRLRVDIIPEPSLQFGSGLIGTEPKKALSIGGPWTPTGVRTQRTFRLGLVGLKTEFEPILKWFTRMERLIVTDESNAARNPAFPGSRIAFDCGFEIPRELRRHIDEADYAQASALSADRAFESYLELYVSRIEAICGDTRPDCVLVALPEDLADLRIENTKLSAKERAVLQRLRKDEEEEQMSLFAPSPEELRIAAELKPQAEELLFRSFYRALKARCMMLQNPVPIQVLRRHTYVSEEAKQSDATRAWNLSTSLYYKCGNIPWRPHGLPVGTCFIGISFHHMKRRVGDIIYASLAQAFSSDVEPFALQGSSIPPHQVRRREPYLTDDQARTLIGRVISEFEKRTGSAPARVVVHKTSSFQPEEQVGFRDGAKERVASCDLVWLRSTGFRLLRRGIEEPWRGTLCSIGDDAYFLFTTGFIPQWSEYPGPHIPTPLQLGSVSGSEILDRAREILLLSKMNWNNAEGIGGLPITISFARRVGAIMTEMGEGAIPNPLYRFYM